MKTIQERIAELQLEMTCARVPARTDGHMNESGMRHFLCTISQVGKGNRRTLALFFSQGSAHTKVPRLEEVLDCIISDISGLGTSFEDWAFEQGYDTDSRKAESIYRTCQAQERALEGMLGRTVVKELIEGTEQL